MHFFFAISFKKFEVGPSCHNFTYFWQFWAFIEYVGFRKSLFYRPPWICLMRWDDWTPDCHCRSSLSLRFVKWARFWDFQSRWTWLKRPYNDVKYQLSPLPLDEDSSLIIIGLYTEWKPYSIWHNMNLLESARDFNFYEFGSWKVTGLHPLLLVSCGFFTQVGVV